WDERARTVAGAETRGHAGRNRAVRTRDVCDGKASDGTWGRRRRTGGDGHRGGLPDVNPADEGYGMSRQDGAGHRQARRQVRHAGGTGPVALLHLDTGDPMPGTVGGRRLGRFLSAGTAATGAAAVPTGAATRPFCVGGTRRGRNGSSGR